MSGMRQELDRLWLIERPNGDWLSRDPDPCLS